MRVFIAFIVLCTVLFHTTGCADRKDFRTPDHRTDTIYENNPQGRDKVENISRKQPKNGNFSNSVKKPTTDDSYLPKDIAVLEEISTIERFIPIEKLVAEVESDIPNKRTIIFKDNETNDYYYKSIYIPSDQHLQIVNVLDEKVIYDGGLQD